MAGSATVPKRHLLILGLMSCGPVEDKGGTTATVPGVPTSCDDALWVTAAGLGRFTSVVLDSRIHSIAFGSDYNMEDSITRSMLAEFDAEGVIVRATTYQEAIGGSSVQWYGGVDHDDNVYTVFSPADGHTILRKFEPAGSLVKEVDLGVAGQMINIAVAVDGTSVVTREDFDDFGRTVLTRVGSDLAVEWQSSSDMLVDGLNSAGAAIAVRYPHELVLLDKGGNSVWERTLDVLDARDADINEAGEIVAGGRTNDDKVFASRFDSAGNLVWSAHFKVLNQFDMVSDVEINAKGDVALSGYAQGSSLVAYAVRLTAGGEVHATHLCKIGIESQGLGIALDDEGRLRLSGDFYFNDEYRAFVAAFE